MDRLFVPFGQTEIGRNSGKGTGLGLAIAKNFVGLMGGEIQASSSLGKGTKFAFEIAFESVPATEVPASPEPRRAIGLDPGEPEYRILVADDRPEGRLVLVELLTSLGFSVREAQNGREAVELWSSYSPHLILMDMRMPVMDGYEATQQIKSQLKGQATAIVALTASAFNEERQAILAAGCDDFMNKPFREEVLLDKIARHLGVCYIYEENSVNRNPCEFDRCEVENDYSWEAGLSQMPPDWIEELHQAALKCRDDAILKLVAMIPESYSGLANCLEELANNFLFDRILELTRQEATPDLDLEIQNSG
jgi:two-component system, sensor histidine kinase and response regulator